MSHYYYSKFDNVNWMWWKNRDIPPATIEILEPVNRQLKAFYPLKILLSIAAGEKVIYVSERNQIDRDNAGRTFSFRQFYIVDTTVFSMKPLTDILRGYNPPANYLHPEDNINEPHEIPASDERTIKRVFNCIWHTIQKGRKATIVNDAIDEHAYGNAKWINDLTLLNFPESGVFINSLSVFPPQLLRRISYCINYEPDFIQGNKGKFDMIDLIYCGNKAVVEENFDVDTKISFSQLTAQGFDVHNIKNIDDSYEDVYSLLKQSDYTEVVNELFDGWVNSQTTRPDISKCFAVMQDLLQALINDQPYTGDKYSLTKFLQNGTQSSVAHKKVAHILISNMKSSDLPSYATYADIAKTYSLQDTFHKSLQTLEPNKKQILDIIDSLLNNNGTGDELRSINSLFLDKHWDEAMVSERDLDILERMKKSGRPPMNYLNKVWQNMAKDEFVNIKATDISNLNKLHTLSPNEEFKKLLVKKFIGTDYKNWLTLIQESKLKISIEVDRVEDISDQLQRIDDLGWEYVNEDMIMRSAKNCINSCTDRVKLEKLYNIKNVQERLGDVLKSKASTLLGKSIHTNAIPEKEFTKKFNGVPHGIYVPKLVLQQISVLDNSDVNILKILYAKNDEELIKDLKGQTNIKYRVDPGQFEGALAQFFKTKISESNEPATKKNNTKKQNAKASAPKVESTKNAEQQHSKKSSSNTHGSKSIKRTLSISKAIFFVAGLALIGGLALNMLGAFDDDPKAPASGVAPVRIDTAMVVRYADSMIKASIFLKENGTDTLDLASFSTRMLQLSYFAVEYGKDTIRDSRVVLQEAEDSTWNKFVKFQKDSVVTLLPNLFKKKTTKDSIYVIDKIIVKLNKAR